ncbi:hypothetical protein QFZ82_005308 [Streptomyces sp. V4I23]|uniref:SCO2584 family spore wall biosynthesis protein n=1 Tax=Streptomyces sp. V4I23 TaxID=3042282 RepID=UPI0027858941|nr:hypothetical protein [Streptomyces sp. V4I23]MDQ1010823.1 hypothetical protein [Streptomyces sp. V4I23]
MPDDVGGKPFQDGGDPEDSVDRGGADQDFASVVFDEDFVRAAEIHEPSAVERLLAAAEARAEAEAARSGPRGVPTDDDRYDELHGPDGYAPGREYGDEDDLDAGSPYGPHGGALRPYRGTARWHRPVAWVLALVMGIGMIALAFTAVYRGASGNREDQVPQPARTGVDAPPTGATVSGRGGGPTAAADRPAPRVPAEPRTP